MNPNIYTPFCLAKCHLRSDLGCTGLEKNAISMLDVDAGNMTKKKNTKILTYHQWIFAFGWLLLKILGSELTMQALKTSHHYFHSSDIVLLRETHLAPGDVLTKNQLSCMTK